MDWVKTATTQDMKDVDNQLGPHGTLKLSQCTVEIRLWMGYCNKPMNYTKMTIPLFRISKGDQCRLNEQKASAWC